MRHAIWGLALGLVGSSTGALAYTADNHEYDLTCTRDGYELRSKYPVSRTIGSGASTRVFTEKETLYLGRSCDALLKAYGYGEWCWANGGFVATFGDNQVSFPRQELFCDPAREYEMDCGCR